MTDAAYIAKNWLMRADALEDERLKTAARFMIIREKVNNSVSSYENTGRRDAISARAAHEDLLADYSTARDDLIRITESLLHEDNITMNFLYQMQNKTYAVILFDKYVNRMSFKDMEKLPYYEIKERQLYNLHNKALDYLGAILVKRAPEIITREQLEIIGDAKIKAS